MKVTFINPPHADWCLPNMATWVFIKSYYSRFGQFSQRIEWVEPPLQYNLYQTTEEIYNVVADCDVVLFSSYIWNFDICDDIAKQFKAKNPKTKLILGGPHIGLNDPAFFQSRPQYDYICQPTKPGEIFIASLFDQFFSNQTWPDKNLVSWEISSSQKKNLSLPDYSVYREHLDYYKKLNQHARQYELEPFVILETTRGCPYSCAYCEWGGGTNTKIVQKPLDVVFADIDALIEAGFQSAYLTDANFGIFGQRDLDIFRYAFERGFALTDISTMKSRDLEVRKKLVDSVFDIIGKNSHTKFKEDRTVRTKATWGVETTHVTSAPTVSLQSVSEEAMLVAKRTDLSFEDKIKLSEHIHQRSAIEGFPTTPIELIFALPGSTINDFYKEFEIIWNFKAWSSFRHDYMFLPDSSIMNSDYLKKYNIELVDVYSDLIDESGVDNKFTLYADKKTYFKTIRSCYSYTEDEFYEMFFMNAAGNYLLEKVYPLFIDHFNPSNFAKRCYEILTTLQGFEQIHLEIKDIFNPTTSIKSIKKIQGRLRTDTVNEFIMNHKKILINELHIGLLNEQNRRRNSTVESRSLH